MTSTKTFSRLWSCYQPNYRKISKFRFLGHEVDSQGIHPLDEKVQVIQEFPLPTTSRKLREFLGLINFYHCFIPHCAHMLQSLHEV